MVDATLKERETEAEGSSFVRVCQLNQLDTMMHIIIYLRYKYNQVVCSLLYYTII